MDQLSLREVYAKTATEPTPALSLRVEGESPIPLEEPRAQLALATGKPVTLDDQGPAGVVVLTFDSDPTGATRVNVVYHPPLAELARSDTLPSGQHAVAHHIGPLAQGLIERNAGITLLTPETTNTTQWTLQWVRAPLRRSFHDPWCRPPPTRRLKRA